MLISPRCEYQTDPHQWMPWRACFTYSNSDHCLLRFHVDILTANFDHQLLPPSRVAPILYSEDHDLVHPEARLAPTCTDKKRTQGCNILLSHPRDRKGSGPNDPTTVLIYAPFFPAKTASSRASSLFKFKSRAAPLRRSPFNFCHDDQIAFDLNLYLYYLFRQ
jgi:hypothetical protein